MTIFLVVFAPLFSFTMSLLLFPTYFFFSCSFVIHLILLYPFSLPSFTNKNKVKMLKKNLIKLMKEKKALEEEVAALKQENNRLRAKCGEEVVSGVKSKLEEAKQTDQNING